MVGVGVGVGTGVDVIVGVVVCVLVGALVAVGAAVAITCATGAGVLQAASSHTARTLRLMSSWRFIGVFVQDKRSRQAAQLCTLGRLA